MPDDHICPYCDHMFKVSRMKSLLAKRTPEGKILRCPKCGRENPYRE